MITVLSKVLMIFAMIALGFVANKIRVLPDEANKYLTDVLILITTPCMIISSMAGRELDAETGTETVMVLVGSVLFFVLGALVALLLAKGLKKTKKEDAGVMMVGMVAVNSAFMGFPVTKATFGDHIFFLMVVQNIILNIYLYSLAVIQMHYGDKKEGSMAARMKSVLNPCVIAVIIGSIILVAGIKLPGPVSEFLETMGDATVPLSMLVVGIQLGQSNLSKVIKNRDIIYVSLINVLLMPMLTFLAVNWLPIPSTVKITLVFAAAFPCAVASVGVATKENRNAGLMAEAVALSTVMSLVSLPLIAALLQGVYL